MTFTESVGQERGQSVEGTAQLHSTLAAAPLTRLPGADVGRSRVLEVSSLALVATVTLHCAAAIFSEAGQRECVHTGR